MVLVLELCLFIATTPVSHLFKGQRLLIFSINVLDVGEKALEFFKLF